MGWIWTFFGYCGSLKDYQKPGSITASGIPQVILVAVSAPLSLYVYIDIYVLSAGISILKICIYIYIYRYTYIYTVYIPTGFWEERKAVAKELTVVVPMSFAKPLLSSNVRGSSVRGLKTTCCRVYTMISRGHLPGGI